MTRTAARFPGSVLLLVLLVSTNTAQAFSFCFSFGGSSSNRGKTGFYRHPPPGPAIYPAYPYPYSPVSPALLYGPYPAPAASATEADNAEPAAVPRPTLGWPK